ncbi:methyltransferase domain-containing protein [bacterium]|nr:methyltransferase domain-containing protein [bacterium]
MHDTAAKYGRLFIDTYSKGIPGSGEKLAIEIGPGGSDVFKSKIEGMGIKYIGFDQLHDEDPEVKYSFGLSDCSVDFAISSSCFEHDELFWMTFLEVMRVLKPHGIFYINAPSDGPYHTWPVDCYRFYPDSAKALEKWGRKNGLKVKTLERFTARPVNDIWHDYVAVWIKDEEYINHYKERIIDADQNADHIFVYR